MQIRGSHHTNTNKNTYKRTFLTAAANFSLPISEGIDLANTRGQSNGISEEASADMDKLSANTAQGSKILIKQRL